MKRLILLAALLPLPLFAQVEVRAHYGSLKAKPSGFNAQMEGFVTNAPDVDGGAGFGADALFTPPVILVVLGLRYETIGAKHAGAGRLSGTPVTTTGEVKGSRTSILAGYRLLSLPVAYLGTLVHVGLAQKLRYDMTSVNGGGSSHLDAYEFKMPTSFGLGVEGGARFNHVIVGGEVGYTLLKSDEASDNIGVILDKNMQPVKIDLSGVYFKIMVGARF